LWLDWGDRTHARVDRAAVRDPVALADRLASDELGDFRYGGDPQIDRFAAASLAADRNAEPQQLVTHAFGEKLRGRREVDFLASNHAAIGFQQPAHERQRLGARQMREPRRNALAILVVVDVVVAE